jgi:branched-chain amino acid transport system ATP-binding protein
LNTPLKVDKVGKIFGKVPVLIEVSLELADGERHAILGPNGAGKTTLFNLICGIHSATSGRILLFGKDVSQSPVQRRAAMGLGRTFQITNLFTNLTVFQNLLLARQSLEPYRFNFFKPVSRYPKLISETEDMLRQWGISDNRDKIVSNLSYGEQRQLEVIMALANKPRMLLLDEPTAGLSPAETTSMTNFLSELDDSITILLVEHDMEVVFSLAEKITVMHYGHVVAQGPTEEIKGNSEVMAVYLGEEPFQHADR